MSERIELFDGVSLKGWRSIPRVAVPRFPGAPKPDTESEGYRLALAHPARWSVRHGAVVGEQDPPGSGYGGYLITDGTFGDFELTIEARPDWPADTGIMLRATELGAQGFQVLLDHRKSGGIGGYYGNGIGGFHALSYSLDVRRAADGTPVELVEEDQATSLVPVTDEKRALLNYAAPAAEFLSVWRFGDWNEFRIRCVGELPVLTTWVNGVRVYEVDTAKIEWPDYDPKAALGLLGPKGHIALEVHGNDARLGAERWALGAVCRWRNASLVPL